MLKTKLLYPSLLMAFAALSLASCSRTDCECFTAEKPEMVSDFTQRAQLLLDSYSLNTKAGSEDELFSFKPGDVDVDWSLPDYFDNRETDIVGIENELLSYYEYRVLMPDGRMVNCDKELLYVKGRNSVKESLYLMYYIPNADYREVHDEDLAIRFKNDGCLEDYTGLKMYTTPDGVLVALNEYVEGECTKSLYLPELETEEDLINGYNLLISMMGGMTVQRLKPAAETKAFNKAVNEVDREFEFSGGELNPAVCRGGGGGGYYLPSSLETWTWLAYCNSQTDSLKENGEDGRDNLGGGGNSKNSSDSSDEENKKKLLEESKQRLIELINQSDKCVSNYKEDLCTTITELCSTEEKYKTSLMTDVIRKIKNLKYFEITADLFKQATTSRDSKSKLPTGIVLTVDQIYRPITVAEELFHASQFEDNTLDWGLGNYEMEAKIFDYLLWKTLGSNDKIAPYFIYYDDLLIAIDNFLMIRNKKNFNLLIEEVKKIGPMYESLEYKDIEPVQSIKHIPGKLHFNNYY